MAKLLPRKDVVIMGLGWTGSILAQELTEAGLDVVAIERGPWRDTATDFNIGYMQDELRYAIRKELFLQPALEAMTMRNDVTPDRAADARLRLLPARLWRGRRGRALERLCLALLPHRFPAQDPSDPALWREARSSELQVQDWGVSYDEIEHCFDQFEYLCGTSGKAGNLKGQIRSTAAISSKARGRANIPTRRSRCPMPPCCSRRRRRIWGCIPFPRRRPICPSPMSIRWAWRWANAPIAASASASPAPIIPRPCRRPRILPVLMKKQNFEARTECEVLKINLHPDGKTAKSVTYVDRAGQEYEQPGDIILLCGYGLMNVRMMLLSGIGKPYDPATAQGAVGRNYCYQTQGGGARLIFDGKHFNPFIAAGALGLDHR